MALQTIQHGQPNWDTPINDMFKELYAKAQNADSLITEDGFSRDFVLTNGLSLPAQGVGLGIDHFKLGSMHIAYGWGKLTCNLKQYQSGKIKLPYQAASDRCLVGHVYSWDGDMRFLSVGDSTIMVTPNTDVNGTYDVSFIMIWSEN